MLVHFLFCGGKFAAIVGEEDSTVQILTSDVYKVDDLVIPEDFKQLVVRFLYAFILFST
jgi:hypothetical protein